MKLSLSLPQPLLQRQPNFSATSARVLFGAKTDGFALASSNAIRFGIDEAQARRDLEAVKKIKTKAENQYSKDGNLERLEWIWRALSRFLEANYPHQTTPPRDKEN